VEVPAEFIWWPVVRFPRCTRTQQNSPQSSRLQQKSRHSSSIRQAPRHVFSVLCMWAGRYADRRIRRFLRLLDQARRIWPFLRIGLRLLLKVTPRPIYRSICPTSLVLFYSRREATQIAESRVFCTLALLSLRGTEAKKQAVPVTHCVCSVVLCM